MGEGCSFFQPEPCLLPKREGLSSFFSFLPLSWPLPLGQAPSQRTHGSRLASRGGVLVYETRDPVLLVGGKVRHAQGQGPDRFEVRRKRESERTKGEGEKSTLFPLFLTPHF